MKSQFVRLLTLVCMLGIWGTASADFRMVWICSINEGKTMDDVRAANSDWVKFVNANVEGGGITSHILTAVVGDTTSGRFIYADSFPTLDAWVTARAANQDTEEGKAIGEALDAAASCSENHLYEAEKS